MPAVQIGSAVQQEVERFLYQEARLLDQGRYHEWLDLFADDVRYWIPSSESIQGRQGQAADDELHFGYLDEDKQGLSLRVKQLDTGLRHVEVPASVTRRFITNILLDTTETDDELLVHSNFLVLQIRHGTHESFFAGDREDRLRRVGGLWKIARRTILVAQPILPRSVSIFF